MTSVAECSPSTSVSEEAQPSEQSIAVIAGDLADRTYFAAMVVGLGFRCRGYANAEEFDEAGELARSLLVCFRVASATTRVPAFPSSAKGCRVLVLSDLEDERHIVETLDSGAHHLFSIDESAPIMRARLKAALRRHERARKDSMTIEPFLFELAHRRVMLDGRDLELSPREFDLAYYLFSNKSRVVTNAELLTSVWSLPPDIDTRRIDTAACRVRKKMELGNRTGWVLRRFRREGYGLYADTREVDDIVPTREERREEEV